MHMKPKSWLVKACLTVLSALLVVSGFVTVPQPAHAAAAVTLEAPLNGAHVSGSSVRLSGSYSKVYDVRVFLNGESQLPVVMNDPDGDDTGTWHYDLALSKLNGEVHMIVRGLDVDTRYGVWSTAAVIHVDNPAAAEPLTAVLSPADGSQVSGTVPIRVAVESPSAVTGAQVRINSGPWTDMTLSGAEYVYDWDAAGYGDRTHSIEARATDAAGNVSYSLTTYAKTGLGTAEPFRMNRQDRSMWIWESETYKLLLNPGSRDVLDAFAKDTSTFGSDPITTFYLAVGPYAGMDILEDDPGKVRAFIEWAHSKGYQVYACIAGGTSPPYMGAYARYHHKAIREIERIINFNLAAGTGARFDGINVDIEPYIAPEFKTEYPSLQLQHLDGLKKMIARRDTAGINLPFGPAIPKWYDTSPQAQDITWNGSTKWLSQHIQDISDYISIMDYRDAADGTAGITAGAQGEIDYANSIGKPQSVVVGVETLDIANSGDPEVITFREEGRTYMEAELDKVYAAFADDASFGGMAMHHYDSIRKLASYWGPGGIVWQAPADSQPPSAVASGPRASLTDAGAVQLNWGMAQDNTELDRYIVYRSTVSGFMTGPDTAITSVRGQSHSDTGLLPGTTYYYRVAAKDTGGNIGPASPQVAVTTSASSLKPMILTGLHVARNGTSATARMRLVDMDTMAPLAGALVEGRFTYSGGRYVTGTTDADGYVAFASETIPADRQIGFEPRRVKADGYSWAQAYDRPHTAALYPKSGLSGLAVSDGNLEPAFQTETTGYTVRVPDSTGSITVTPTAAHPQNATVQVNGTALASGAASAPIALDEPVTVIPVIVPGAEGEPDVYTVTVIREAPLPPVENVFVAVEDATVYENEPTVRRGSEPLLDVIDISRAAGGGDRYPYFKFNLSTFPDPVDTAKLYFYVGERPAVPVTLTLNGHDADSWSEAAVNWNTRPLAGSQTLGTVTVSDLGWHSVDVTAFVKSQMGSDKTATFRLMDLTIKNTMVKIHSKDHAENRPYLVLNPSADASLSRLRLLEGDLTPAFDPQVMSYSATVTNQVYAATIVPTAAEPHASVRVNGLPVPPDGGAVHVPLAVGVNPVTVAVYAQNGIGTSEYRIEITRELPAVADLAGLTAGGAELAPAFDPHVLRYSATVTNDVYEIPVTALAADPLAGVTVNGTAVDAGTPVSVPLLVGDNTVEVQVTAQNGSVKHYTLVVTRRLSANADLAGLQVSHGSLTPAFRPDVSQYSMSVTHDVYAMAVYPTAADAAAVIRVNGVPVESGQASGWSPLYVGSNLITVQVQAQDGMVREYRIEAVREGSPEARLSGLAVYTNGSAQRELLFSPDTLGYRVEVPYGHAQVRIAAAAMDSHATVKVDGAAVAGGAEAGPFPLAVGINTFTVQVTAQNGSVLEYVLTVVREENRGSGNGPSETGSTGQNRKAEVGAGEKGGKLQLDIVRTRTSDGEVDMVVLDDQNVRQALSGLADGNRRLSVRMPVSPGDGGAGYRLTVFSRSAALLAEGEAELAFEGGGVSILLPRESLEILSGREEAAVLQVLPMGEQEQDAVGARLFASGLWESQGGEKPGTLIGDPLRIESSYTGVPTKLLLPVAVREDSDDAGEIAVYIEHSDGERVLKRGQVVRDAAGRINGIEILIDKFSTFAVVELPQKAAAPAPASAPASAPAPAKHGRYAGGYGDGTFRPDQPLSRGELAALLDKLLSGGAAPAVDLAGEAVATGFKDVPTSHWASSPILRAAQAGLMKGTEGAVFAPDAEVTRAELAVVAARWCGLSPNAAGTSPFADAAGHWAEPWIAAAVSKQVLKGYEDGSFRPEQAVTRAEAVTVLNRVTGRPSVHLQGAGSWKDVPPTHWAYQEIERASRDVAIP